MCVCGVGKEVGDSTMWQKRERLTSAADNGKLERLLHPRGETFGWQGDVQDRDVSLKKPAPSAPKARFVFYPSRSKDTPAKNK